MGHDEEGREEGRRESGIPRRTLIKRGAIVGGLVWATPVVQSLRIPANAQGVPGTEGSGLCQACVESTFDPPGAPPPITQHILLNPTERCCSCIESGGGTILAVIVCAVAGTCEVVGGVVNGECDPL
jgi:hypothetical protein